MASSDNPKTILLRGNPGRREAVAGGAITPGMLLVLGAGGTVTAHATTSTARYPVYVARENEYAGHGIADAYASGDRVGYYAAQPGDEFYALLETGQNIAVDALLASNAAGALEAASTNYAVFQAMEALNNTSGANARIRVRTL